MMQIILPYQLQINISLKNEILLTKKKFKNQGYAIVKNVLNFNNDLKPILNDMEFVMDCLIQKYA
jgi:hypothetical protein